MSALLKRLSGRGSTRLTRDVELVQLEQARALSARLDRQVRVQAR
jgi:hypothetical protein